MITKICAYCRSRNAEDALVCTECLSPLKNATISTTQIAPKTKKTAKPRKTTEYVKLYHGPMVKKSTAQWLARKNRESMQWAWWLIIIPVVLGLLSRCGE